MLGTIFHWDATHSFLGKDVSLISSGWAEFYTNAERLRRAGGLVPMRGRRALWCLHGPRRPIIRAARVTLAAFLLFLITIFLPIPLNPAIGCVFAFVLIPRDMPWSFEDQMMFNAVIFANLSFHLVPVVADHEFAADQLQLILRVIAGIFALRLSRRHAFDALCTLIVCMSIYTNPGLQFIVEWVMLPAYIPVAWYFGMRTLRLLQLHDIFEAYVVRKP